MAHWMVGRLGKQSRLEQRDLRQPRLIHRNGQLASPLLDTLLAWQLWGASRPLLGPSATLSRPGGWGVLSDPFLLLGWELGA